MLLLCVKHVVRDSRQLLNKRFTLSASGLRARQYNLCHSDTKNGIPCTAYHTRADCEALCKRQFIYTKQVSEAQQGRQEMDSRTGQWKSKKMLEWKLTTRGQKLGVPAVHPPGAATTNFLAWVKLRDLL